MAACSNPCSCCSSCSSLRCRSSCLRSRSAAFSCRRSYTTHGALNYPFDHLSSCLSVTSTCIVNRAMKPNHSFIQFMHATTFIAHMLVTTRPRGGGGQINTALLSVQAVCSQSLCLTCCYNCKSLSSRKGRRRRRRRRRSC